VAFQPIVAISELQKLGRTTKIIEKRKILLIWHNNNVHAVQAQCPHLNLPLIKAEISKNDEITCPFHKSVFCLTSGSTKCWSPWPPFMGKILGKIKQPQNLTVYKTKVEEGMVLINVV
jgi:nitrite reductase/ring-hydroxylating ferredoxin subunit